MSESVFCSKCGEICRLSGILDDRIEHECNNKKCLHKEIEYWSQQK